MRINYQGIFSKKLLFLLVFFIFHFSVFTGAQAPSWAVGVRPPLAVSYGNSIVQTKDGGYLVGGNGQNIIAPRWLGSIAKFDSEGNVQWASEPGEVCNSINLAHDGGYVVVGTTDGGTLIGGPDVFIVKFDSAGNTQWTQTIGGIRTDAGNSIISTNDGGYAITGSNSSFLINGTNVYVIKLNSAGNVQWTKTIGGTGTTSDDAGYSIIQTKDEGYAITGTTTSYGAGREDVYVVKLDSIGNLQWTRTIGGSKNDYGNSIIQSRGGGYAVTGVTYSFADTTNGDVYIVKLDSAGNLEWTKTVGGTGTDVGQSIIQTNDGGYSITGTTNSYGGGEIVVYYLKLDSLGVLTGTRTLGFSTGGVTAVRQTKTGGFALAGNTTYLGYPEYYVSVLDSAGSNCSTNSSGGIVDSGGAISSGGIITTSDSGRVVSGGPGSSLTTGIETYLCSQYGGGLTITSTVENNFCQNFPDGSISLAVSGGNPPYTYSWSPNVSDTSNATGLSPGTFTITVADSANDSVTMIVPLLYNSDVSFLYNTVNPTCKSNANGIINLTNFAGTPPFTYSWSNGETSVSDSGLTAGTYSVIVTDSCGDIATSSFTITQTPDLSDSASIIANVSCYNDSTGIATVSVSAGTAPFTYLWNDRNSQTTATATGLKAGIYSVTVTDTCGGTALSSVTITQPALWQVNISLTHVSCAGQNNGSAISSLNVPLVANYSFEAAVQHFVVPSGVTTITVSIAGAQGGGYGGNGASFTGACSVIPGHVLSVAVGEQGGGGLGSGGGGASWLYDSNIVLYSPSGDMGLIAVAGGGGGNGGETSFPDERTYYYIGGAGGFNLITNAPTVGTEGNGGGGTSGTGGESDGGGGGAGWLSNGESAGFDSGGRDEANHFIAVTGHEGGIGGFGGGGGGTSNCEGPGCGGSGGGGGGYNGGGSGSCGGGGGSYFVNTLPIVSDSGVGNGFVIIAYIVTGYDSTYSYSWSNGETTYTATGLSAGTYSLTVSNSNGCSATTSVSITQPNILTISAATTDNVNCGGGNNGSASSAASGGASPYTYLWSDANSQTTANATGLIAGIYTVIVTDSNGCTASAFVSITQPTAIVPTITLYSGIKCNGDSGAAIFASATGGTGFYEYQWSGATSQTNAIATGLSVGTYTVTVTDNNGCTGTASATLSQPQALSITADSINATNGNCNGSAWAIVNGGTNPYSYLWTGGLTTDTILNQCTNYYCCIITDANGCVDSVCVNIDVSTGTNEVKGESGKVKVYPNPSNGSFTMELSVVSGQSSVEIYNVLGEKVFTETLRNSQGENLIDLTTQSSGVYFYRVIKEDAGLIGSGKIVIVRMDPFGMK
jgi:hypothetical protein